MDRDNDNNKFCMWHDICADCPGICEYFTPCEPDADDLEYYRAIIEENVLEYQELLNEINGMEEEFELI